MKTKAEIKELISNNKLEKAIEEIKFVTRGANEAIQLSGRLASALKNKRLGQISDSDHEIAINRISSAMLNYVDSIDDSQFPKEEAPVQKVQGIPEIPPPIDTIIETQTSMSESKVGRLRAYRKSFLNTIKKIEFDTEFKKAREKAQSLADSMKDYLDKIEIDENYDFNDVIYERIMEKKSAWIKKWSKPINNRDLAIVVASINAINSLVDNMDGDILIDAIDEMIFMGHYVEQFTELKKSAKAANKSNNMRRLGRIAGEARDLMELTKTKI